MAKKYSEKNFKPMYMELIAIVNLQTRSKEKIIDTICRLLEGIVWSEQNDENKFFEYFAQNDMQRLLPLILDMYRETKEIVVQAIQFGAVLIHNVETYDSKSKCYLEYLVHSRLYEVLLAFPYDFTDREIAEQYAVLMKGLTVNLPQDLLRDVLLLCDYSVFEGSQRFIFYPETMVRTACRTAILNILRIEESSVRDYILTSCFIEDTVSDFRENLESLDKAVVEATCIDSLEESISDEVDTIYFINDIFAVGFLDLSAKLVDVLLKFIILPKIIGSLISDSNRNSRLSISLSLFLLVKFLRIFKHPALIDLLISILIHKDIQITFIEYVNTEPPVKYPQPSQGLSLFTAHSTEMTENTVRKTLYEILRSRDSDLITLTLLIFSSIRSSTVASSELIQASGLTPAQKDPDLVHLLLELLCVDSSFKMITAQLICSSLIALLHPGSELSSSEQNLLFTGFMSSSKRMEEILAAGLLNSTLVDSFEEEWAAVSLSDEKVQCTAIFLVPILDDFQHNIPLKFRRPCGRPEQARTEIHFFYLLTRTISLLCKELLPPTLEAAEPLLPALSTWELRESYKFEGFNVCRCLLEPNTPRYFVEDEEFFLLVEPEERRLYYARVTHLLRLRHVEVMIDQSQRSLRVSVNNKKSAPLALHFAEPKYCVATKQSIERNRKASKELSLSILHSLFSSVALHFNKPFN